MPSSIRWGKRTKETEQSRTKSRQNNKDASRCFNVIPFDGISTRNHWIFDRDTRKMFLSQVLSEFWSSLRFIGSTKRFNKFHIILLHEQNVQGYVWSSVQKENFGQMVTTHTVRRPDNVRMRINNVQI